MMEVVLVGLGFCALFFWFISGLLNRNQRRIERELEAYDEAMQDNAKADDMLNDPDYMRRMFDEDNS